MEYDVVGVKVVAKYVLELRFEDGTLRVVDLEPELWGPAFEALRDPTYFARVTVDRESGNVTWPNGADLSPEFLYDSAKQIARSES
jgi:hypothetical protein